MTMFTTRTTKKILGKALLSAGVALAGMGLASGTAQAFNPQPEPPGKPITNTVNPPDVNRGGIIAVNPAPERPIRPQVAAQFGG
jgi:hypothetical protein